MRFAETGPASLSMPIHGLSATPTDHIGDVSMKQCKNCNTEKPKSEFSKHPKTKDLLQSRCKSCAAARDHEYYAANRAKVIDRAKAYYAENTNTVLANVKAYREANPEKVREAYRSWKARNPDKKAASTRAWYMANTKRALETSRAWREKNPERISALHNKRRAAKLNAAGSHTAADVYGIFEKQRGLCANCKKKLIKKGKNKYHADHIYPLSRGGSNDKGNLQCLCPGCNHRKYAKDPLEWAKENGRLL